jgi:RNA polymerase sigma factor (sigma-70 family)
VRNDALKHLRKEKQTTAYHKEVVYLYGSEQEKDCFHHLIRSETLREILSAIHSLPTECSKVFRMMYIEGKSIKETAEALQLSPSTVKTQKKRGIDALRKGLRLTVIKMVIAANLFPFY